MKVLRHIMGAGLGLALGIVPVFWASGAVAKDARKDRVHVFAAASLKTALDEVAQAYGAATVVASYGGSATMARQVNFGAPADIVLLANPTWMDWLQDQGGIVAQSRADMLGNRLVLIAPKAVAGRTVEALTPDAMRELLGDDGRLAIGQVDAVPAGIYGREWLVNAGLWDSVRAQLAETENVRAALALVARGEVPAGVVYTSDARAEPRVRVVYEVPEEMHATVRYPVALVTGHKAGAEAFLTFLQSEEAMEIFARHGFLTDLMADGSTGRGGA